MVNQSKTKHSQHIRNMYFMKAINPIQFCNIFGMKIFEEPCGSSWFYLAWREVAHAQWAAIPLYQLISLVATYVLGALGTIYGSITQGCVMSAGIRKRQI